MKVCLDLDGTLANLHSVVLPRISVVRGEATFETDIDSWHWAVEKGFITPDQEYEIYVNVWNSSPWQAIEPYERDIMDSTMKLRTLTDKVDIVTVHPQSCEANIKKWLDRWQVYYDDLICVPDNGKQRLEYDTYIDDDPSLGGRIAQFYKDTGIQKRMFMYSQPWNKKYTGVVTRVATLSHTVDLIEVSLQMREYKRDLGWKIR